MTGYTSITAFSLRIRGICRSVADNSGIDGDVYEDLSEEAQYRLASLHNLMTSCLIGL
jgi:hypothetical protein